MIDKDLTEVYAKIAEYKRLIADLEDEIDNYSISKLTVIEEKRRVVRELAKTTAKINFNETHPDKKYGNTKELYEKARELTNEINDLAMSKKELQDGRSQAIIDLRKMRNQLAFLETHKDAPYVLDRLGGHHSFSKEQKLERYYTYPSVIKRLEDRKAKKE